MSLFLFQSPTEYALHRAMQEDEQESAGFRDREYSRKSHRKHPHSQNGVQRQKCGGGYRIIKRKIGND